MKEELRDNLSKQEIGECWREKTFTPSLPPVHILHAMRRESRGTPQERPHRHAHQQAHTPPTRGQKNNTYSVHPDGR
jgi:hypothetical protein